MIKGEVIRKEIPLSQLDHYGEKKHRLFGVPCREDILHVEKFFEKRKNLRNYVEKNNVTDVNIIIYDILE